MEPKRISLTAMRTLAFGALVWCLAHSASAAAAEVNCRSCHGKPGKEKVQHAALGMGCLTCHAAIDASAMPHKKTNTIARGLTAEQPDLCYGCHDAGMFSKKTVHAAVGMGCTGCHNPHSTDGPKFLKSDPPDLCFTCHDKAEFSKKKVHAPVAGGMCLTCHTPHSSDTLALLTKEPLALCLDCHGAVEHVIETLYLEEPIFQFLPFRFVNGVALQYTTEQALPGVDFRKLNAAFTEVTGVVNRPVEALKPFGLDSDTDKMLAKADPTERQRRDRMALKAMAIKFVGTLLYGNSPSSRAGVAYNDVDGFDGIQARLAVTGTNVVDNCGVGGADGSSVFVLRFGDGYMQGLMQAPGPGIAVTNLGEQGDKPVFRTRIDAASVLTTTVSAIPGVTLVPNVAGRSGLPGAVVTYTLAVTNTGNASDTFTVTVAGNAFATSAPSSVGPLISGAGTTFDVGVTIPAGATGGSFDSAMVGVTSHRDGNISDNASLTTTVLFGLYLPLTLK